MRLDTRITDPVKIDGELIESELENGKHVIVQFSGKTYNDQLLTELNELCMRNNKLLGVRFYGHHQTLFDCKTVEKIPQVKTLYVDCLTNADNMENYLH